MSIEYWNTCIKFNITPNLLYLLECFESKIVPMGDVINWKNEIKAAKTFGLISTNNQLTKIAQVILKEHNTFLEKKQKEVKKEVLGENFEQRVNEYRELFPKDRYIHSNQLPRQSVKELIKRFIWFFKEYPDYDWDLVIDATRYYIALHEKSTPKYNYMMTSSYFIKKTDAIGKDIKSKLADYCEQLLENGDDLKI